jgi:hypothetical protein
MNLMIGDDESSGGDVSIATWRTLAAVTLALGTISKLNEEDELPTPNSFQVPHLG